MSKYAIFTKALQELESLYQSKKEALKNKDPYAATIAPDRGSINSRIKDSIWFTMQTPIEDIVTFFSEEYNYEPELIYDMIDQQFSYILQQYVKEAQKLKDYYDKLYIGSPEKKDQILQQVLEFKLPNFEEVLKNVTKGLIENIPSSGVKTVTEKPIEKEEQELNLDFIDEAMGVLEEAPAPPTSSGPVSKDYEIKKGKEEEIEKMEKERKMQEERQQADYKRSLQEAGETAENIEDTKLHSPSEISPQQTEPLDEGRYYGKESLVKPEEETDIRLEQLDKAPLQNMLINSLEGNLLAQYIVKQLVITEDLRDIAMSATNFRKHPFGKVSPEEVRRVIDTEIRPVAEKILKKRSNFIDAYHLKSILKNNNWLERK